MPLGFQNITTVTIDSLINLTNVSSYAELAVNVNHDIYGGWFWFLLLCVLTVITYFALSQNEKIGDKPLVKALYAFAFVTLISFISRAYVVLQNGIVRGLLSDYQMWVFPLATAIIAGAIWMTQD